MEDAAKDGNGQKRLYVCIEKQWNKKMHSVWRATYSMLFEDWKSSLISFLIILKSYNLI